MEKSKASEYMSTIVLQYHLYCHPIYEHLAREEKQLNVLLIGFGYYGQKFLDVCLQAGQIRGKNLNVTVVSDSEKDKALYLKARPELSDFFNIDGSMDNSDNYGQIDFEVRSLTDDISENADVLQNIMIDHYDAKRPHFVFIALGNDDLNYLAACSCKTVIDVLEMPCGIHYVSENGDTQNDDTSIMCPVCVHADPKVLPQFEEIERMAFNVHLTWEKDLNIDYGSIRHNFKKPYNRESSLSCVLSIKSKLYAMHIDLDKVGFEEAARICNDVLCGENGNRIINELAWIEHRRWVTEKLCQGYRRIRNYKECATGMTKDDKKKCHVCLVPSRPDRMLDEEFRTDRQYSLWNTAKKEKIQKLDQLDQMSLQIHRMFAKQAEEAKDRDIVYGHSITAITELISGYDHAVTAFQEWYLCVKEIWGKAVSIWRSDKHEKSTEIRQYKGLKNSFLKAVDNLPIEKKSEIIEHVKAFDASFYPFLASVEYRDWKMDDIRIAEQIPFILTFTQNTCLAIPFTTGSSTDIFENVAAPVLVNPERILYLILLQSPGDLKKFTDVLPNIVSFLKRKKVRSVIDIALVYEKATKIRINDTDIKAIKQLGGGKVWAVKQIFGETLEQSINALTSYLEKRKASKNVFTLARNQSNLSTLLQMTGFYSRIPHYQFDSAKLVFDCSTGCDMLRFIRKEPNITVSDLLAFHLSAGSGSKQPEFYESYKTLWKLYNNSKRYIWKELCKELKDHLEKADRIASFQGKKPHEDVYSESKSYRYIIPFSCGESVGHIIQSLRDCQIVGKNSGVCAHTTDSCLVTIEDYPYPDNKVIKYHKDDFDQLLSGVHRLMLSEAISTQTKVMARTVNVIYDSLEVKGFALKNSKSDLKLDLLTKLEEAGMIMNLRTSGKDSISFTFASRQVKDLLTVEGRILEIYTYHKIRETGYFDDVVCGFEVDWEKTGATSELDCVVTAGFQSIFVECKACDSLEQDFYYKLSKLRDQFGINTTAVLISDTSRSNDTNPNNPIQIARGDLMGVVTIDDKDDIGDIGNTLVRIIEGHYTQKTN